MFIVHICSPTVLASLPHTSGLPNLAHEAVLCGPQGLFAWLISSWKGLPFCLVSSVWFSRNQFGFAEKTFFLVFTYFWGQIPKILAKVSTDFVQQTCTYMEFNLGEDA